jgi:hypothetical protein
MAKLDIPYSGSSGVSSMLLSLSTTVAQKIKNLGGFYVKLTGINGFADFFIKLSGGFLGHSQDQPPPPPILHIVH